MAITSYAAGFKGQTLIKEIPLMDAMTGKTIWVSSTTGGAGNPGTFNRPVATLAQALSLCSANAGDLINLKPLHAETISAAAGIALSVAGVRIVGWGQGANRPTFTWSATTSTMTVSAANIKVENVIFKAGIDAIVLGVNLLAGSTDFHLDRVAWYDGAATFNFILFLATTATLNAHDGLTITRNEVVSTDTGNTQFVGLLATTDRFVFEDNVITMGVNDNQAVIKCATGKFVTACSVRRNTVYRGNIATTAESGDVFMGSDAATNTGVIADNYIGHLDPLAESTFNVTGAQAFNNYSTGVVDKSGYILPAVDS